MRKKLRNAKFTASSKVKVLSQLINGMLTTRLRIFTRELKNVSYKLLSTIMFNLALCLNVFDIVIE